MRDFKTIKKVYIHLTKIEIIYIVIAIVGVIMILCSTLVPVKQENNSSKILSTLGSLGTGIFPTGTIGFILERTQMHNEEFEKSNKRLAILCMFNNAVHSYFNVICNSVIKAEPRLKNEKIFKIMEILNNTNHPGIPIETIDEEFTALTMLVERLKDLFSVVNPLYIATDIFTMYEINCFEMILKDGRTLLSLLNKGKNASAERIHFISYLKTISSEIPECSSFNKMISNGDNIFIPQV